VGAVSESSRCPAANREDPTPREGDVAVRIVDQRGTENRACVHHGARMYASLVGPRVYPLPGHDGAALEVYYRAQALSPFPWIAEAGGRP
jgi:hypothetical protein